jgi:peptide chain release factor subunit 3
MADLNSWEDDPTVQEENLSRQTQQMNLNNTPTSSGFRPGANSFQPSAQPFQPSQPFQQYGAYDQSHDQRQYQQFHSQGQGYGYPQYNAQGGYGQYQHGGYSGAYNQSGYNQQYGMKSLCRETSDWLLLIISSTAIHRLRTTATSTGSAAQRTCKGSDNCQTSH